MEWNLAIQYCFKVSWAVKNFVPDPKLCEKRNEKKLSPYETENISHTSEQEENIWKVKLSFFICEKKWRKIKWEKSNHHLILLEVWTLWRLQVLSCLWFQVVESINLMSFGEKSLIRGKMIGRERNLNRLASCLSPLCNLITNFKGQQIFFFSYNNHNLNYDVFYCLRIPQSHSARLILYTERNYRPKICSFHNLNHRFLLFNLISRAFLRSGGEAKKLLKNNDKFFFALDGSW